MVNPDHMFLGQSCSGGL